MFRDFFDSLKPRPQPFVPFACIIVVVFTFYFASAFVQPGWVTYWMSTLPLLVIVLTAWARLNDIKETDLRYQARKLGLILVIAACTGLILKPWVAVQMDWPTWSEVMLRAGFALVWLTTPMMPPWDRYISGKFRQQVVEVPKGVEVEIVRTDTVAGGGMFQERRKNPAHTDEGP